MLLFVSLMAYGSYFAYDSIGAIPQELMDSLHVGQREIGLMYSAYSVGAILTLLMSGMLLDRIGARRACVIFAVVVTLGAAVTAQFRDHLYAIYAGRLVFGAGSEALIVAQSAVLARWFKGRELAFAFGAALTISRLGTLFTFNTEALIAERYGAGAALWTAAGLCLFSTAAAFVYSRLDRFAEGRIDLREGPVGERIRLADVRHFRASYWAITLLCLAFYSAIFPFQSLSTDLFQEKWGLPSAQGGGQGFLAAVFDNIVHMFGTAQGTTSILTTASMVCAPFAGLLVDRVGRRATLLLFGSLLMIPAFLLLGFTSVPPALPMIVLGASFVLVPAALWPAVALLVSKERAGTAYGLMTLIQNVGLVVFSGLNGWLRERTGSYTWSLGAFAALGVAGFVLALWLRRADAREGGALERP